MELSPREKDKLLLFTAALVAERRKARGLKLNYPEAIAYISAAIVEGARQPSAAAEFYEFVTSVESLLLQAEKFYRIPARRDIPRHRLPVWMREMQISPLPIDWDTLAANEQRWMQEWDERVKGTGSTLSVDR